MLHTLLHKNKVIGLFSDYKKCNMMLEGLVKNSFAQKNNLLIKSFHENSIMEVEYTEENLSDSENVEEFSDSVTTKSEKKEKTVEEINKMNEIQNKIIELKKNKEKMEESKRTYDVDYDLFLKFKKIKESNNNFDIPELFKDKYDLMVELEKENKLCWDNFRELFKPKQLNTSYSKLFE